MARRWLLALIFLLCILLVGDRTVISAQTTSGFNQQFARILQPYTFNYADWEVKTITGDIKATLQKPLSDDELNSQAVIQYFSYVADINKLKSDLQTAQMNHPQADETQTKADINDVEAKMAELKPAVEQTIARQITLVLADQGINNPFANSWLKFTFPAVKFKLETPLYALIVSSRDKIEQIRSVIIRQDITQAQIESVESSTDNLGVSSLIVPLGGLAATYPSFVQDDADINFTLETAAHEWVHQYLTFKPLGFRYVLDLLGITPDDQIKTLDETVADMLGQELGALVFNRYYSQIEPAPVTSQSSSTQSGFDFNRAMRQIRLAVDSYLVQGQVDQAEEYMKEQQQYLASQGYYIRKLNQAYFAFYGSYADSATSVDPIGSELKSLRAQSPSMLQFLETASDFKSQQDLLKALGRGN